MTNTKQIKLFKLIRKEDLGQSAMTSGNAYKITLRYNNKHNITFIYNDNYKNDSGLNDFIYAITMDAEAYANAKSEYDFICEYGYNDGNADSLKKGFDAFKACKKMYYKFIKLGIILNELFEDFEALGY